MTQVKRVRLQDLGKILAEDIGKIHKRVVKATHDAAESGAIIARSNSPEAFGELKGGIFGGPILSEFVGARVRSTAPHSAAVEEGSRPHFPPIEPIERWVKLRGMQGLEEGAGRLPRKVARMLQREEGVYEGREIKRGPNKGAIRLVKRKATDIDAPRQIALAICRAIAARGTKPTWFMKRSVAPTFRAFQAEVERALEQDL